MEENKIYKIGKIDLGNQQKCIEHDGIFAKFKLYRTFDSCVHSLFALQVIDYSIYEKNHLKLFCILYLYHLFYFSPMAVSGTFFVSAPLATVLIKAPVIINGIRVIANSQTLLTQVYRMK